MKLKEFFSVGENSTYTAKEVIGGWTIHRDNETYHSANPYQPRVCSNLQTVRKVCGDNGVNTFISEY